LAQANSTGAPEGGGQAAAMQPRDRRGDEEQDYCGKGASTNDEKVGECGEEHRNGEKQSPEGGGGGHQNGHRTDYFDRAGDHPEPLADTDLLKNFYHHRYARELGSASGQECGGSQNSQCPGKNVAASASWGR